MPPDWTTRRRRGRAPWRLAALGAVFVLGVLSAPVGAQPASASTPTVPGAVLTYEAAVQRALGSNPRITAARLGRPTTLAARDVAAERLNPEFRVELAKETPKEGYTFGLPLELGGKRARRIEVADAAVLTGDAEIGLVAAEVVSDVRRAYLSQVVAEQRAGLLEEMAGLAQRVHDTAQARLDAGSVPRLDVVIAHLALAESQNQTTAARGAVDAARVTLNALLGLPLDAATHVSATLEPGPAVALDAALARARQSNAELQVADRRIEEQRARVGLAHAMRAPDLTPEATLTRRAEPEFQTGWRASIGITLPLFTTHRAGVTLEDAALAQLASERAAIDYRIAGEVASTVALAESRRQQCVRYRDDVVPQAQEVERMAEDAYRLGQTGINAYLQAVQASRDVRLRALQAAADLQDALADLDRAAGTTLRPLP